MKYFIKIEVLILLVCLSCTVDKVTLTEFVYINESSVTIDLIHYWNGIEKTIEIEVNDSYSVKVDEIGGISVPPVQQYDSIFILFDKNRYLVYKLDPNDRINRNPYFFDSYEKEKLRRNYYKLTYVFAYDDFLNAKEINP